MDKVDSLIDELMDKVDECEDEMKRMRECHAAEIASLQEQHGKALRDKDAELAELTLSHKQAVAKLEVTIKDLQTQLQTSQEKYAKLENREMMENYEQLIREQDDEDDSEDDEEESIPTPVRRGRQEQTETSGTRRMVRSRTSKVAVQVDADAAERMKKRIPEFVMIYFSPFSLRDRGRESWSQTLRPSQDHLVQINKDDNADDNTDDESDSDDSTKDDTTDSTEYPMKKYIPRRIRLVDRTDEVALDVRFNHVAFEIPASTLQCRTVENGHAFLAELLEGLIPAQQEQKWKFTM